MLENLGIRKDILRLDLKQFNSMNIGNHKLQFWGKIRYSFIDDIAKSALLL